MQWTVHLANRTHKAMMQKMQTFLSERQSATFCPVEPLFSVKLVRWVDDVCSAALMVMYAVVSPRFPAAAPAYSSCCLCPPLLADRWQQHTVSECIYLCGGGGRLIDCGWCRQSDESALTQQLHSSLSLRPPEWLIGFFFKLLVTLIQ